MGWDAIRRHGMGREGTRWDGTGRNGMGGDGTEQDRTGQGQDKDRAGRNKVGQDARDRMGWDRAEWHGIGQDGARYGIAVENTTWYCGRLAYGRLRRDWCTDHTQIEH